MIVQSRRFHYAWVALAVVFVTLVAAASVRAAPSVLILPLERAFGWSPTTIAAAISVNILLYGLMGPFAAASMQRFGVRPTLMGALVLIEAGVVPSLFMRAPWQLILCWGLLVGAGAGTIAPVLGATVVNRWFVARRGLAMGIATAATAAGQLMFLPVMARLAAAMGWQSAVAAAALSIAAVLPVIFFLMPERPSALGLAPYGETGPGAAPPPAANPLAAALLVLGRAVKVRDFWIFAAVFFVCGSSTNGLVGTHLIPFCYDNGIGEVQAASLLAAMGAFNIAGATSAGWLSDRYDNRVLLTAFFGLRGLSLLYLPYSHFDFATLSVFAAFYGLDWIATVPPMMRLITDAFGKTDAPVVFGWIFAMHQLGGGSIAVLAGALRASLGSYLVPFLLSGTMCLAASLLVLSVAGPRLEAARAN